MIRNNPVFRSDEGAALVEMALSITILFVLLLGVFEVTLAAYSYHYISDAAREGARWAIVRGSYCKQDLPWAPASFECNASDPEVKAYVRNLGYPDIDPSKMEVTTTWYRAISNPVGENSSTTTWATTACDTSDVTNQCNFPGNEVQVTVTYTFPFNFIIWKPGAIPISSTSKMVISQ